MSASSGNAGTSRSRQVKSTMAAAAALFCGIFVLMGVQMALGKDPAIGTVREAGKATPQKAQGAGDPIVPPARDVQPAQRGYSDSEGYYDQPSGGDGYYDQGPSQDYGQAQPQQYQQQSAPPVQSGAS